MKINTQTANRILQNTQCFDKITVKSLNQTERELILTAIKVATQKIEAPATDDLNSKEQTEKSHLEGLRFVAKRSTESVEEDNCFVSFFKGIANLFFGRISSAKVLRELEEYKHYIRGLNEGKDYIDKF